MKDTKEGEGYEGATKETGRDPSRAYKKEGPRSARPVPSYPSNSFVSFVLQFPPLPDASLRMPIVTMPTFSTPAPLAASMTDTMSP